MLVAQLRDTQQSQRRVFGRLQHQSVARRYRHRDLQRAENDRSVPRHNSANHADWLATRVAENVLTKGHRFAFELADDAAKIADHLDGALDLWTGLGANRVSRLQGDGTRD